MIHSTMDDWLGNSRLHNSNETEYNKNHQSYSNYTFKTSVIIRVTPRENHFVSWGILCAGFLVFILIAFWQVLRERTILESTANPDDDLENGGSGHDGETRSTAEITRCIFRRTILLAMVARLVMIPVQIWSDPMWMQFVGDTLPEMIFASAWSIMVTFFVQLVGVAEGVGANTKPGIVIQVTAYAVYGLLICLQLFDQVASVLLYALLCCIYAALFGTVLYFCPRLLGLLAPSHRRHGGLLTRLFLCSLLCLFLFGARAFGYARRVMAPPGKVYWWWNYGCLELIPSALLLILMNPQDRHKTPSGGVRNSQTSKNQNHAKRQSPLWSAAVTDRKQHPLSATSGSRSRLKEENVSLLKGSTSYGSTTASPVLGAGR